MNRNKLSMIGTLAAIALSVAACAGSPAQRSTGQSVDDSVLAVKVKTALIENKDTKARDINVEVFKGEVQLNGFVDSAAEKDSAIATAKRVEAVRTVRNNLQVQTAQRTGGDVIDDAVITTKVKAALVEDSRTKAYQIEVTTHKGEVQLGGFVDSADARTAAAAVAQTVAGVRAVKNGLEVKG